MFPAVEHRLAIACFALLVGGLVSRAHPASDPLTTAGPGQVEQARADGYDPGAPLEGDDPGAPTEEIERWDDAPSLDELPVGLTHAEDRFRLLADSGLGRIASPRHCNVPSRLTVTLAGRGPPLV